VAQLPQMREMHMVCNLLLHHRGLIIKKFIIYTRWHIRRRLPCQLPDRMKNSSYYSATAGIRTSDLRHSITMSKKVPQLLPVTRLTHRNIGGLVLHIRILITADGGVELHYFVWLWRSTRIPGFVFTSFVFTSSPIASFAYSECLSSAPSRYCQIYSMEWQTRLLPWPTPSAMI